MEQITVRLRPNPLGERSRGYSVHVGDGLISEAGRLLAEAGLGHKAVIVTDTTVGGLYADALRQSLESSGFESSVIQIPPGEHEKSLERAGMLYDRLTDLSAERTTAVVALGGGVIGDLSGFVAATYLRGVPLVQVPTTLLSQGDSSIGGKVAVNHGNLKNRIGAFYHPRLTISDTGVLRTLSPREVSDGLAEIIKHGIILDAHLFDYLENNLERVISFDQDSLEHVVGRSAAIKAGVVAIDELDLGPRNILNYGHTVGHAIESVSGLSVWHGEAVAMGMVAEARLAEVMGIIDASAVKRITSVIQRASLPVRVPGLDRSAMVAAMQHDKKVSQGKMIFALPTAIGHATLVDNIAQSSIEILLAGYEKT